MQTYNLKVHRWLQCGVCCNIWFGSPLPCFGCIGQAVLLRSYSCFVCHMWHNPGCSSIKRILVNLHQTDWNKFIPVALWKGSYIWGLPLTATGLTEWLRTCHVHVRLSVFIACRQAWQLGSGSRRQLLLDSSKPRNYLSGGSAGSRVTRRTLVVLPTSWTSQVLRCSFSRY